MMINTLVGPQDVSIELTGGQLGHGGRGISICHSSSQSNSLQDEVGSPITSATSHPSWILEDVQ